MRLELDSAKETIEDMKAKDIVAEACLQAQLLERER